MSTIDPSDTKKMKTKVKEKHQSNPITAQQQISITVLFVDKS